MGACIRISIHALLAESDSSGNSCTQELPISIHALLAESDVIREPATARNDKFLSTLSLRRATIIRQHSDTDSGNFYPRSPCGERPDGLFLFGRRNRISIHALLAESDCIIDIINNIIDNFYPRSPCGERRIIDIINNIIDNFYPRSPCGERLRQNYECFKWIKFLSTLSLRRATCRITAEK